MSEMPDPPKTYEDFNATFPELGEAWQKMGVAGKAGPMDEKTARLVKLAIAIGAQQEGAVHASVRKGLAMGITPQEMRQVVALAASTLGFPKTVAAWTWVRDLL